MILIDVTLGYYNLTHDKKSFYLTIFVFQLGRCRLTGLPIGMVLVIDMFHQKNWWNRKGLPNVFDIADNILIV